MINRKINSLNCDKCKKRECEYSEVEFFIEELNRETRSRYEFQMCLDNGGYGNDDYKGTVDLCLRDDNKNQLIYAEVKRVFYGYEELNIKIANENSSHTLFNVIQGVINWFDKVLETNEFNRTFFQLYTINIPNVEIGYNSKKEIQDFVNQFSEYIIENYFCNVDKLNNLSEFSFKRKTKNNEEKVIIIKFTKNKMNNKKNKEVYEVDSTENENGIAVDDVLKTIFNYNCWAKKIIECIGKCKKTKFDSDISRLKVLILVPKLSPAVELFLDALFVDENFKDIFWNGLINEFNKLFEGLSEKYNYIDKIYFIYTSEKYNKKILLKG